MDGFPTLSSVLTPIEETSQSDGQASAMECDQARCVARETSRPHGQASMAECEWLIASQRQGMYCTSALSITMDGTASGSRSSSKNSGKDRIECARSSTSQRQHLKYYR